MDFDLSPEQLQLQDALRRLLRKEYGFDRRKSFVADPAAGRAIWARYAEMGLLALPFAAEDGGLEASPADLLLVLQEFGRALVVEPYVDTVVVCGGLVRHLASRELRAAILPAIAEGRLQLALAHEEHSPTVRTVATPVDGGWTLDGRKPIVVGAPTADRLLVSAVLDGRLALFLVAPGSDGLGVRAFTLHDGTGAAEVVLDRVKAGAGDLVSADAARGVDRVFDEACAAVCADTVGAMEETYAMTLDYLRTRQQFGTPIGTFQALRHKAADMCVALEHARSMAILAMLKCPSDDDLERRRAVSAAKVLISLSGRRLGQAAIQLHGAIGMTDEYKVGHLFKRIEALGKRFGDTESHIERLAACGGALA